jgi:hypothetical protein
MVSDNIGALLASAYLLLFTLVFRDDLIFPHNCNRSLRLEALSLLF